MDINELKREIEKKKNEARKLLDTDLVKAEKLTEEVRELQKKLELKQQLEDEEMRDLQRQKKKKDKEKENEEDTEKRALDNLILPGEKFERRNNSQRLRLDKLIRGMAGRGWEGAAEEEKHYRSMTYAGNSTIIPKDLMGDILDVARTNSAVFGRIPVVKMKANNLTVAIQTGDPEFKFKAEGEIIPESGPAFTKVTMEGKTLGVLVNVTEELLDSAENLEYQLVHSCGKAIALAIDKALLYGDGEHSIKGISTYENINKMTHVGESSYDMFIKGIKESKKANVTPTDIAYSTDTGMDLAMLKDSNGQYITKPGALNQYTFTESNNVKPNEVYVYDSNSLLLGIHENINIQWSVDAGDNFRKLMSTLRVYARIDLAVVNPKGITQITITE